MNSEQITSLVRNTLQFASGAFGLSAYLNGSTIQAIAAAAAAIAVVVQASYAARQAAKAKGKA